ncbi:tape measure protein [Acinetobacter bereziniae]|uniref:tape measure protein n=1 Tax=Acinetobacter bereziniae TaxID=106648 RepID=UPI001906390C|nr:tape measure protein [Acinetobacter bereziniae]QQC84624.1 tape measure protein [Acinetobacter bereziniae]
MSENLLKRVEILLEANTARFETGMARAGRTVQDSTKTMTKGYDNVKNEVKRTQSQIDDFSKTLDRQDRQISAMAKSYGFLASSVKSVVAGISVGEVIGKSDEYVSLHNRLKLVTNSQSELNRASEATFEIAQKTGAAWDGVADIYSKFSTNSKTLHIDQKETARLTEIVTKATAISGSSASGAQDALTQFGQALASGKLQAEEFSSMQDNASGVLDAMARGLGKTRGELRNMMLQGELTGDVIVKSLLKAGSSVDTLYDKTDKTVGQAFTRLNNELVKFVGEASNSSGASVVLANGINLIAGNINELISASMVAGAYFTGKFLFNAVAGMREAVAASMAQREAIIAQNNANIQLLGIQALRAKQNTALALTELNLARVEYNQATSASARALAVQRLTAAEIAYNIALKQSTSSTLAYNAAQSATIGIGRSLAGLLLGPVGLGVAVAGVAASYLYLKSSSTETSQALTIQGQTVDELRDKYEKLSIAQQKTTLHELKKEVEDLRVSFVVAGSDLSAFVEAIPISDEKIATVRKLYNAYAQGKLTSDEFNTAIEKLNFLTDDQKLKINQLSAGYDQSKVAYLNAKSARDSLVNSTPQAVQAHNSEAEAVRLKNIEIQKTKELQANAAKENLKNQYFLNTVKASGSNQNALDYATFMTKFREDNKIPFTQILSSDQKKIADQQFALQQKVKEVQESITASVKTQTKEMEKQAKAAAKIKDYQVESLVKGYAEKYNFSALERSINAPDGLLSAIMSKESNGRTYRKDGSLLTSPVGAQGSFQFMPGTARQYRVDVKSVQSSAQGATRYLGALYKQFGSWDKAIAAYNAGPGNVEKYGGIPPFKETQDYVRIVKGKMASLSGFSPSLDGERSDPIREFEQLEKDREQLRKDYQNRDAVLVSEHQQRIADLTLKFAGSEQQALIKAENERFTNSQALNKAELEYDLNAYKMSESEKLEAQKNIQILQIKASTEFSDQEKQLREKSIRAQYDKELKEYRQLQWQKLAEYNKSLADIDATSRDMIAQSTMTPQEYKQFSFKSGVDRSIDTSYYDQSQLISKIGNDDALTDDQKKQKILDAEKTFQDQRYAIIAKATKDEADLRNELYTDQLNMYGSLLSQAGTVWGSMTDMVKESAGESSAAYKTMFLVQQVIAMGQAIINTEVGATAALKTDPTGFMSMLTRGLGYASVGVIAAQTVDGIFHGGESYVPKEASYYLDKGERVLSPRQNKDLTNYLSNQSKGGSATGNVQISQSIVFTDTGAKVDTQGQKQVAQSLNLAMNAWAKKESMQGGILYKLVRGLI